MNNAGFWVRLMAYNIDFLFLLVIAYILRLLITEPIWMYVMMSVFYFAYEISFTLSRFSGTPGKIYMGLKVIGMDNASLSISAVMLRTVMKLPSLFFLFIGFAMISWRKDHRSLHDLISSTRVIFK